MKYKRENKTRLQHENKKPKLAIAGARCAGCTMGRDEKGPRQQR